ncbi:flagellar biosynthetic protein FliR [Piscinibacter aquaticus]|uniref:Flagellar biosynthetic protein FliR n=1 Tax=Piscinibacter aquaticus TaxID=392597 RepID=A0A5C6U0I0_9BURK|nr:flagellar biosynthetic protein FliR [Piscinibacter aquaticus]
MFTVTEAQILAWITPVIWPFLRVLALLGTLPVIGQRTVPARARVALAFLIAVCAQASLPPIPPIPLDSAVTFLVVLQQIVIGVSLGFAVRIVFAAVEFAGELVGLQMGLNFAGFFDPATGGQTTAVSRFFGVTVSWLFVVTGGHLLVIAGVMQSFHSFPVGPEPFAFVKESLPHRWGAEVFAIGLWIALPMVAMLLFVNLVMGIASRVAQQLNLFAIGFPITLTVGLVGVLLTLPMMQAPFTMALERMLQHFQ